MIIKYKKTTIENDGFERYTNSFNEEEVKSFLENINFPATIAIGGSYSDYFDWHSYDWFDLDDGQYFSSHHGGSFVELIKFNNFDEAYEYLTSLTNKNYDDGTHEWEVSHYVIDSKWLKKPFTVTQDGFLRWGKTNTPLTTEEELKWWKNHQQKLKKEFKKLGLDPEEIDDQIRYIEKFVNKSPAQP